MEVNKLISKLKSAQEKSGEFKSFCYLPEAPTPQWYYSGDSPFVTANILFSIRNIQNSEINDVIQDGLRYLDNVQEKNGLWRYWRHNNGIMEYNVPCDIDDTSLVSFLKKKFSKVDELTEELLLNNRNLKGQFYTWFRPTFRHLTKPAIFAYIVIDMVKSLRVFLPNKKIKDNEPISSLSDREPAVIAHLLMFLGKRKETEKAIDELVTSIQTNTIDLEYYDHRFYVYHHVSRAYSEGVNDFELVKEKIIDEIIKAEQFKKEDDFELLNLLNLITLQNFGFTRFDLISEKVDTVLNHFDYLKPYKYWTSKQRSWFAGSEFLTLALFIEFISNLQTD